MADTLRLFFALKPSAATLKAIERLRNTLPQPEPSRTVPLGNTHLTLAFLGDTPRPLIDELKTQAALIQAPKTSLVLDSLGWFRRSQVLWLGPSEIPEPVALLAGELRQLSGDLGLHQESREFRPHVTLYRKVRHRPPWPEHISPPITLSCENYGLYASLSQHGRTHYLQLGQWPLQ